MTSRILEMPGNDWCNYFDDIVCINLRHRPDRQAIAKQTLDSIGIPHRFYVADKDHRGGIVGCFASHLHIISDAYQRGYERILVFEDDIRPSQSFSHGAMHNMITFMRRHPQWDIFYPGYFSFNNDNSLMTPMWMTFRCTDDPHVVEFNPFATHAYCINRKGMYEVMRYAPSYFGTMHIDIFLSKLRGIQRYCYVPMLFEQRLCMENDIAAMTPQESALRSLSCMVDRTHIMYWVTWVIALYTMLVYSFQSTNIEHIVAILIRYIIIALIVMATLMVIVR